MQFLQLKRLPQREQHHLSPYRVVIYQHIGAYEQFNGSQLDFPFGLNSVCSVVPFVGACVREEEKDSHRMYTGS